MTLNEKIVDVSTNQEIIRPYTAEEIAEVEAEKLKRQIINEEQAKAEADKEAAKAKLEILGLTADDLKALGL